MTDLALIIPTFRRAAKLGPLLENIAETTSTPHRVYLVVENKDRETVEMVRQLEGDFIPVFGDHGGCAASTNAGYRASCEPYFLFCNDDVRFTEDWDLCALEKMKPPVQVVGINQGDGRTESFALIARDYIEQHSGVFDRPNTVMHPYRSQFCDDELADTAKARGVWAAAADSVIQHLHWTMGLSEMDDNYRLAVAAFREDQATYMERKRQRERAWAAA